MIQIDSFAYANNPFYTHGDSSSLIVTREDNNAIGLLWGGWQENWTYGVALDRVLTAFNIQLLTGPIT